MPGALNIGNPPSILTPGRGPNGPGPIDCRMPETSVGAKSSCPYGVTNGYANPNGVTGFIGPAAGSLRLPTSWYFRIGGSEQNGGTSSSLTPDRTGTDGVRNATTTFTSASANFTMADVNKGIFIVGDDLYQIRSFTNSTTVILDRATGGSSSGNTWNLGGAFANPGATAPTNRIFSFVSSPLRLGDIIYIGAGTYRGVITVGPNNLGAFNGLVQVIGDVAGQFTGDAGMVQLTAFTTNDKTAPSGSPLFSFNNKSNLSFSGILFVGGTGNSTIFNVGNGVGASNITLTDCGFLSLANSGQGAILIVCPGAPVNWLINRCDFIGTSSPIGVTFNGRPSSDYNSGIVIINSRINAIIGAQAIQMQGGGSGSGLGGGVIIRNCFIAGGTNQAVNASNATISTIFPCRVISCVLHRSLAANTLGQIVEDFNLFVGSAGRTNVGIGTHSVSDGSYAVLYHFGQERIWGGMLRPFGEPMASSPLLGFGSDGAHTLYDLMNRPRPAGGGSGSPLPAIGALERGNTAAQGTSPSPPSGTYSWQFTGPGYQDLLLPVSAVQSGFSISVQRDAGYAAPPGATNPSLTLLANPTIGVTGQTVVDSGASGQWNTLTLSAFTPTGTGWVTLRVGSFDASGTSVVSFAVAAVT